MGHSTWIASAARTDSGVSDSLTLPRYTRALQIMLKVTAAATESGDILAVFFQGSLDGGTSWYDIGRFADVLGNGGAKTYIMNINRLVTPEVEIVTPTDGTLAASTVNEGPTPDLVRIKYVVTDAGTDNASFTFSVVLNTIHSGD